MQVSRKGALAMLVITILWAVTPAIACTIPLRPMTQAEQECCEKMCLRTPRRVHSTWLLFRK
jgi:hypothetical protein